MSKIKIDRSFIGDIHVNNRHTIMVSSVIALAHHLGLSVVAEGVETFEQLRFLRDGRCDAVQGYLLGRPQPASSLNSLIAGPDSENLLRIRRGPEPPPPPYGG